MKTSIALLIWSAAAGAAPCGGKCDAVDQHHAQSPPSPSVTQNQCSSQGGIQACCDGFAPSCLTQLVGSSCNTDSYCCDSKDSIGGLININALNCAKILG